MTAALSRAQLSSIIYFPITVTHIPQSVPVSHFTVPDSGIPHLLYLFHTNIPPEPVHLRETANHHFNFLRRENPAIRAKNPSYKAMFPPPRENPPMRAKTLNHQITSFSRGKTRLCEQKPPIHHPTLVLSSNIHTKGKNSASRAKTLKQLFFMNAKVRTDARRVGKRPTSTHAPQSSLGDLTPRAHNCIT